VSTGLIALLDDITAIAKLAAVALDDAASQAAKAGSKAVSKAAGIVIDDAAVTPRYVVGLAAKRELPIIGKIALGSLKNKLFYLLPSALLLSYFAPLTITPLLMIGGAFLCFEGWHKVADLIGLHSDELDYKDETKDVSSVEKDLSSSEIEEERINSAIRTDFILSAEIMAITLSTVSSSPVWLQGMVLALSGLGMTVMVYGAVAIIVKADDFGAHLALKGSAILRCLGRAIVFGMPIFLQILTQIGMLAMLWVGGGIIVHGLHVLGVHAPEDWINGVGDPVVTFAGSVGSWLVKAVISAVIGLVVGFVVDPISNKILLPIFVIFKRLLPLKN
jgi:predicted DNA repair protein MutK